MIRLRKSTRYALYAAIEMASGGSEGQLTSTAVAERYDIPASVVAKVFQQLVRAGLAHGARGAGGGYRLTRDPADVTLLEVVHAIEPGRADGSCLLDETAHDASCDRHVACRLRALFDEVDEFARCTFASITLETLVGRPRPGRVLELLPGERRGAHGRP